MTMTTFNVELGTTVASGNVATVTQVDNMPVAPRGLVPAAIEEDQVYYWTSRWQEDEGESLGELAAGQGVHFASAGDAIRWLLDSDD